MSPNSWICLHPSNATQTTVSLDNRGLAYGDGFFTTMGVIDGQILWLDYHQQRLVSHAVALQLQLDSFSLLTVLKTHAKQLQQGMLKLIVTRAEQEVRGYGYTPNTGGGSACEIWLKSSPMAITTARSLPLANNQFLPLQPAASAICLSSQIACLPPTLAGLKSLNRLDNVLASGELQAIKAKTLAGTIKPSIAEGLLRDMSGQWVEGTMSNVFYQLVEAPVAKSSNRPHSQNNSSNYLTQGQWYTPSMAQSGVAGVMRQVIIDALANTERPVVMRSLHDEDLPRITRLFFCNALRGIMPMSSLRLLSGEVVSFEAI
ncbi:aminodeoxychorismate lyase [Psychrobacter sp. YGAH215]|uniref:aminotransferase class IV n=1 Tax=Psychrobacter sp. YGAH215 TaxID=2596826 RepID=UPI001185FD72|nr:aminotransferase class IV [Psychrobacter sp. YGAH215]TSB23918.1 aminodeoxychorismate lyase [Psychrobacter sp. YGAH215]